MPHSAQEIAALHDAMRAGPSGGRVAGDFGDVDELAGAEELLSGILSSTVTCGWLDDVGKTIKDNLGDIKTGAAIVAGVSAAALLGPQAAPVAAQLSGQIIDAAAGNKAAQKKIDAAEK